MLIRAPGSVQHDMDVILKTRLSKSPSVLHYWLWWVLSSFWQYIDSLWGLLLQASVGHIVVIKVDVGTFGSVDRYQGLLENEIGISIKLLAEGTLKCSNVSWWIVSLLTLDSMKHWRSTSKWRGFPNLHWLPTLHWIQTNLDFYFQIE